MIRKAWLGVLCGGLLLVAPVLAWADAGGGGNGGGNSRWDSPQEKLSKPQKVQAEYETGYRYLKAGDYKKAIKSFESVLKEDSSHALAYSNMGYSYRKLKQYDKAIELYGKALMLDPKLAEAHEYLGEAYLEMGNIEEAKQHLTILQSLDPKLAEELRAEISRYDKRS
jgi:tetratricopeptide (TPR) repeat protein